MLTRLLTILLLTVIPVWVQAAENEKIENQKKAALADLTKAGLKTLVTVQTDHILTISSLPEPKANLLAQTAEKIFEYAREQLKIKKDETLWPGKLTLIILGDNREYSSYMRVYTQQRPDSRDWFNINTRGDIPTTCVVVDNYTKLKDPDLKEAVSTVVAASLLNKKVGTGPSTGSLPEWVQVGFGKLMYFKSTGGSTLANYRSKSKSVVVGTRSRPSAVRLSDVWSGVRNEDSEYVYASLVEYMMYGIEGDKFLAFAAAFKPNEEQANPTVMTALEVFDWKPEALDVAWRVWVSKAK